MDAGAFASWRSVGGDPVLEHGELAHVRCVDVFPLGLDWRLRPLELTLEEQAWTLASMYELLSHSQGDDAHQQRVTQLSTTLRQVRGWLYFCKVACDCSRAAFCVVCVGIATLARTATASCVARLRQPR